MNIGDRVKEIAEKHLQPKKEITSQSKIADDLGADSLDVVDMVMAVEEAFKITISDEEIKGLVTIEDVATIVGRKQQEAA